MFWDEPFASLKLPRVWFVQPLLNRKEQAREFSGYPID
jgi:hypothetical protein